MVEYENAKNDNESYFQNWTYLYLLEVHVYMRINIVKFLLNNHLFNKISNALPQRIAVKWPQYCPYGVKHYIINQASKPQRNVL